MSFARKIKRARGMARRRERKRIQKDLKKQAQARDAEKQRATATAPDALRVTPRIAPLKAKIENGDIVIEPVPADGTGTV